MFEDIRLSKCLIFCASTFQALDDMKPFAADVDTPDERGDEDSEWNILGQENYIQNNYMNYTFLYKILYFCIIA